MFVNYKILLIAFECCIVSTHATLSKDMNEISSKKKIDKGEGMIKIINAYQTDLKLKCVVLSLKTQLDPTMYAEFSVVNLNNPEELLEQWIREDRHGTKFDTGCTVIVTESKHLQQEMERSFKNLLWIVIDHLSNDKKLGVESPVVELYPSIAAFHCPNVRAPRVSYYDKLRFCDKLVKLNGQYLEYSIPKYLTFLFYDEEGKPEGTMYQFMKIFAEYMDFKPSLIGAANFIASIKNVERGNARIGVGAPSFQTVNLRNNDYAAYTYIIYIAVEVPVPKRVSGFDQILLPLQPEVWLTFGGFVLFLSVVFYLVSRLCIMKANPKTSKNQKAMIKEKFFVDYINYVFFIMLKNSIGDTGTLGTLQKSSKAGVILFTTLIIGGFWVTEYYLSTFLSSLTVPYYEKEIKTIPDLLESNLTIFMLDHPVWHALETDPRKDVQNMYKSKNKKHFNVKQQKDVLESGQAHVSTVEIYELKIKKDVEQGLPPSHKRLDENIVWLTYGNHLKLNDVLTESVITYLGRMQDSGIVRKILSKYYMSNAEMVYHIARVKEESGFKVLSYDVFVLTLSIYGGMILIAMFVFVGELLISKSGKKQLNTGSTSLNENEATKRQRRVKIGSSIVSF